MNQQFFAGVKGDRGFIPLGGPFPTRVEAEAWARSLRLNGRVITWSEPLSGKDQPMVETKTYAPTFEQLYEQLLDFPKGTRAEIDDDRIIVYPMPGKRHVVAATRLGMTLGPAFDLGRRGPGGWWILNEPHIRFADKLREPDLAGWRRERMPRIEVEPQSYYFDVVPDWICEFISPGRERNDREIKRGLYAQHGVQYYWLGDPPRKTLDTFVLDAGELKPAATFRDNDQVAAPPFHEITFALGDLWLE